MSRHLRSNRNARAVFMEKRSRCKSFEIYGPKLWNKLPVYIKKETKFPNFKKNLKTYLFKQAFNV